MGNVGTENCIGTMHSLFLCERESVCVCLCVCVCVCEGDDHST